MTHQKARKSGARSVLLTLALVLVLLPLAVAPARAEVRYENKETYWSGDVYAESCAGWPAPEYSLYSNYNGQVLKVYLEGDTNLIIPEGKTLTARLCAIETRNYTLTVTGGGTLLSPDSQLYGNIVISGSALDWQDEMEVQSLTVENGGTVNLNTVNLHIMKHLTVNDGSVTASTYYGIMLDGCDMTVNEGGRVTVVKGGIVGESWNGKAPSVILNGGVLKSDDYRNVPVTVAPGWTYAADGEGSYTGTLSAEQLAAAANKWLASPPAQIGATKYSFLQDAFDAAGPDDAVRLLRDVKQPIGETLNVNGSLTLDLNGHTITERLNFDGAIFTLASGAALTLSGDGRIVDTAGGDVAPYTFVVRGAGAAESSVIIAGGTVVFGGTVTNGWYDGNITFLNCGVTVNGGSLHARTRSTVIESGSLTVNDGAVVDLGITPNNGECLTLTDVTVNSGSLLLRGKRGFLGGTGDKKTNTMTINGGTVELRESDMGENPNGNGIFITGRIKLNGGALRMGMLAGGGETIAFSDAYTYAVEGMPGTYCGVTLTKSEADAWGNRWITPVGAAFASGDFGSGASYVRLGNAVSVFDLPADAQLIAARYDENGKLLGTQLRTGGADRWCVGVTIDANAATYKLMLVDKTTWAPLCPAWVYGQ